MNLNYRIATKNDALGFETVAAYSWKDTYWNFLPHDILENRIKRLSNPTEIKSKIEFTEKFIETNLNNIFVATDNNRVIGILEVGCGKDKYESFGRLGSIYLLPEYKGYGIGKELFKIGLKRLIDMGYNKMQLECLNGNPTIDFYKKYGGIIVETVDDSIYSTPVKVDIVTFNDIKNIYKNIDSYNKFK